MKPHRIYVAASRGSNLRPLLDALNRAGHRAVFPGDDTDAGESGLAAVRKAVARSDVLLLVLTDRNATGAAFEAGLAVAQDIPVLIAATTHAIVPASLRSFPVVSFKLADPSRILDALQVLSFRSPEQAKSPRDIALGDRVERYRGVGPDASEADRVRSLSAAIEGTGAIVENVEGSNDRGFDIAVWSDDLANSLGAPVLIEVKANLSGDARRQIQLALRSQPNGSIGLLVYRKGPDIQPGRNYDPQVLAIQEDELLQRLKEHSFAQIVMMLRNSAMHASEY